METRAIVGYMTLQFHWGGLLAQPIPDEPWSLMHLVYQAAGGGTPGPTLCGIDRFAHHTESGESIPGWTVGGGVSGHGIPVRRCEGCNQRRLPDLPVKGLHSGEFEARP